MSTDDSTFHVMAKPRGAICNLDCSYCYYLEKKRLYPDVEQFRMSDQTLETYIRQYLQQPAPVVNFAWQGGEPTLMGLEFFEKVVELQEQYRPEGVQVQNALQTNGTFLDEDWCEFLKDHDFLVGISIDGPRELHDRYRMDKGGEGSWDRVMRGLRYLQEFEVEHNVLCCVNAHNGHHPLEIYDFFKQLDIQYWQFIPIVERESSSTRRVTDRSVRPEQYGDFLIQLFNHWVRNDVGKISVQIYDMCLRVYLGMEPNLCIFQEACGDAVALEHNGDLYSCDHFVDPDHLLGNIHERSLEELVAQPRQEQFGADKQETLPEQCRNCSVEFLCRGGCPKNRFKRTAAGAEGLNYLCRGYRRFFEHVDPYMQFMAGAYRKGRSPATIMPYLQENPRAFAPDDLGRNDPCYCGSGVKYKYCCAVK